MTSKSNSWDLTELESVSLFKDVDLPSIQHLLAPCTVKNLNSGEVLIVSGSPNRVMYVLLSGRLRVHLNLEEDPLTILEPGDIVGELSVIDGQPTSAHVLADDTCRVLEVSEDTSWALMRSSTNIAYNLITVLAQRLRGGNSVIATTQELQREFERYAVIDGLTGLYNRRWLDNTLQGQMDRCRDTHRDLSVLIMDLDHFKNYNDSYGHLAGDHVLTTVGRCLTDCMRTGEMITRYGGDEFFIVMPDMTSNLLKGVTDRLRKSVKEASLGEDWTHLPPIGLSIGGTQMTEDDTFHTLIARADDALYQDKTNRRKPQR
ncbi:MAG: GGDEF domain-containing protein [Acidobacteriota bacterium]